MSAAAQQKPEIKIKLSVVKGPHQGQVFNLSKPSFTIGRGPENDIVLLNDPLISRSHVRVSIVERDLEVVNISGKNSIIVQGDSVQKWKIVNNSSFMIGETELNVEFDLGSTVMPVSSQRTGEVVPLKIKANPNAASRAVVAKNPGAPPPQAASSRGLQTRNSTPAQRQQRMMKRPAQMGPNSLGRPRPPQGYVPTGMQNPNASAPSGSLLANPKFKFYLIAIIALAAIYFNLSKPNKKNTAKKIISTLKYEDEVNAKLASKNEKEAQDRREALSREKARSPQAFRIQESFVRGMRDYQLGNYTRAQEAFQLILNLEPDHVLAKRYLYLSRVRFDEIVQEKLMLGESYFKKHNFRMCESLYRQVMDMLNGKGNDQKYLLASKKARECQLANEGIH